MSNELNKEGNFKTHSWALSETVMPFIMIAFEKSVLPEYRALQKQNSDLVGWLSIKNTAIDYPVMYKRDDNEFALILCLKKIHMKSSQSFYPKDTMKAMIHLSFIIILIFPQGRNLNLFMTV